MFLGCGEGLEGKNVALVRQAGLIPMPAVSGKVKASCKRVTLGVHTSVSVYRKGEENWAKLT